MYAQDATVQILADIVTSTVDSLMDNNQRDAWIDITEVSYKICFKPWSV